MSDESECLAAFNAALPSRPLWTTDDYHVWSVAWAKSKASSWLPIETAPLDGTVVFVSGIGGNGRFYTDAKWHREWLMFHPEDDAYTMPIGGLTHWMKIPDVLNTAKADAILKEIGEPVKYGCHHNDTVTDECAIDTNSPLCITARALAKNGFQKEQCSYWRPIK